VEKSLETEFFMLIIMMPSNANSHRHVEALLLAVQKHFPGVALRTPACIPGTSQSDGIQDADIADIRLW
jgi:hypothetical protein